MNERESAENGGIAAEATDRKLRSESILRAEGVPFIAWLPAIETADEALKRSKEEVALRTLCLSLVAAKAEGLEQDAVERVLNRTGCGRTFLPKSSPSCSTMPPRSTTGLQFIWRHEAAWTLLWALGFVAQLGKPAQICDVEFAAEIVTGRTVSEFIENSKLRPIADILDQADLIYRYHWAVRNARIKGQQIPAISTPA